MRARFALSFDEIVSTEFDYWNDCSISEDEIVNQTRMSWLSADCRTEYDYVLVEDGKILTASVGMVKEL